MSKTDTFLASDTIRENSRRLETTSEFPLWTDQYNNIVQLLRIY